MSKQIFLAYILILLGVAGIILPIIPGIIFLLLAANILNKDEQGQKWLNKIRSNDTIKKIIAKIKS